MLDPLFIFKRWSSISHRGFFIAALLSPLLVQGFIEKKPCPPCPPCIKIQPIVEAKVGYFFFADSVLRKIYDKGGLDLQLSASIPVCTWQNRYSLEIYGSVEYLKRHGKLPTNGQKTSIWEVPVSLGLKPVFAICPEVHYYFTFGPRYFHVHQHNKDPYLQKNLNGNGIGLFVNTGFNFFPWRHLVIDVFGEYSYERTHFHTSKRHVYGTTVQVGGYAFGAGLGYAF
jgi:hypothetical protein